MAKRKLVPLTLTVALALAACADHTQTPLAPDGVLASSGPQFTKLRAATGNYVLIGSGEKLPANLAAQVTALGGTLKRSFPEIGVAVASAGAADFADRAARIKGMESVVPDLVVQWAPERKVVPLEVGPAIEAGRKKKRDKPADESLRGLQWAPDAIQAPEAWAAGYTGKGVRIAVIDGGIHARHVDIDHNLDRDASASMVPGQPFDTDVGTFWHSTHVAGILAARGIGTIGIAPEATIIGVKAMHNEEGEFGWLLEAIQYAATPRANGGAGADIINMSLGAVFDGKGQGLKGPDKRDYKKDVNELMKAIDRAVWYANRMGVTVIAATGNDALDFDFYKEAVVTPAGNRGVISIAATAPRGWALGATDFGRPASYTNFGKSLVSFSAPGGDYVYPADEECSVRANPELVVKGSCQVFDMVMAPVRGEGNSTNSYGWAAGTSQAAPVAAGVAALIIQQNGGHMHPAQVEARLLQSSIGNGKNDFHGHGQVNAFRAIRIGGLP